MSETKFDILKRRLKLLINEIAGDVKLLKQSNKNTKVLDQLSASFNSNDLIGGESQNGNIVLISSMQTFVFVSIDTSKDIDVYYKKTTGGYININGRSFNSGVLVRVIVSNSVVHYF